MKTVITVPNGVPIWAWINGVKFEESARLQVEKMARLKHAWHHIAIMPDCHAGYGSTVGSVIATVGAVTPSFVGVDISCGMSYRLTSLVRSDVECLLKQIRAEIEKRVPHGRTADGKPGADRGAWSNPPDSVRKAWAKIESRYEEICTKNRGLRHPQCLNHLSSLGSGNHFLEVVEVFEIYDNLFIPHIGHIGILLHSGSRGAGNKIGTYFSKLALQKCIKNGRSLEDKDLAYFTSAEPEHDQYLEAMWWAHDYAAANRALMMAASLESLRTITGKEFEVIDAVDCNHNYAVKETWHGQDVLLTRKGAVEAGALSRGIIPGSMGAKSFIVRGLGNPDSFNSCSHGAGRTMSRTEAKRRFTVEDHRKATEGIECLKDRSVIDESPGAYKPIEDVLKAEADLVAPQVAVRQLICIKGGEDDDKDKWKKRKERRKQAIEDRKIALEEDREDLASL